MHVVVTGANRGLGLAMVQRFLEDGHRVEATARDPDGAAELSALARAHDARARIHRLDVADAAQCRALGEALAHERIDRLVNNAGIDSGFIPFDRVDDAEALRIFDVDALGPLRVTRALADPLERAGGVVVEVSSRLASIANCDGLSLPYRMAKAALNMQARTLAQELRPRGIAVVAVSPGWVRTDMGGDEAPLSVAHASGRLASLVTGLSMAHTGRFLDLDGRDIPW